MRCRQLAASILVATVFLGCGAEEEPAPRAAAPSMTDGAFWALMQETLAVAGDDQARQAREMRRRLAQLGPERIEAYARAFERQQDRAYRWDVWAAASIVNGGCGDDCFEYFRWWLISRGRAAFEQVLADPGSVGEFIESADDTQLELFGSPEIEAYEEVTGEQIPPREIPRPETPAGTRWDEGEVDRLYPALAKRFG